jgi:biotin synthase
VKKAQPESVEAQYSRYQDQGEKPRWTRPEHKIERNEQAKEAGKVAKV